MVFSLGFGGIFVCLAVISRLARIYLKLVHGEELRQDCCRRNIKAESRHVVLQTLTDRAQS